MLMTNIQQPVTRHGRARAFAATWIAGPAAGTQGTGPATVTPVRNVVVDGTGGFPPRERPDA